MTYSEVTDFLFGQLPMYQRQGVSAFKKNLDNIIKLCVLLGNPQEKFRSIHIAGTNGKGSVSHIIAAGLQANGHKVGVYTSPHYKDYRERIKINGTLISEEAVIDFVLKHKTEFLDIQPSFFEITVAMAFDYFAKQEVDIAIIETGLGGRLDSTNLLTPLLSVITNISLDHQSMLGDTLDQIAGEKAGIIKPNVPVIIGEYQEEVFSVFQTKAEQTSSLLTVAEHCSSIEIISENSVNFKVEDSDWNFNLETSMTSPFQLKNLQSGLFTLYYLKEKFDLDTKKIIDGIKNIHNLTYYIGRWMTIQTNPTVIVDSAHNEAGISLLADKICNMQYDKLHIIYGAASDKGVTKILALLPSDAEYYLAKANIPRGMKTEILKKSTDAANLYALEYPSVIAAYRNAIANAQKADLVLVVGSIFVVAEVL